MARAGARPRDAAQSQERDGHAPRREVVSLRDGRSQAGKVPRFGWMAAAVPETTTPALGRRCS
jgi:hypothetical protein